MSEFAAKELYHIPKEPFTTSECAAKGLFTISECAAKGLFTTSECAAKGLFTTSECVDFPSYYVRILHNLWLVQSTNLLSCLGILLPLEVSMVPCTAALVPSETVKPEGGSRGRVNVCAF